MFNEKFALKERIFFSIFVTKTRLFSYIFATKPRVIYSKIKEISHKPISSEFEEIFTSGEHGGFHRGNGNKFLRLPLKMTR